MEDNYPQVLLRSVGVTAHNTSRNGPGIRRAIQLVFNPHANSLEGLSRADKSEYERACMRAFRRVEHANTEENAYETLCLFIGELIKGRQASGAKV